MRLSVSQLPECCSNSYGSYRNPVSSSSCSTLPRALFLWPTDNLQRSFLVHVSFMITLSIAPKLKASSPLSHLDEPPKSHLKPFFDKGRGVGSVLPSLFSSANWKISYVTSKERIKTKTTHNFVMENSNFLLCYECRDSYVMIGRSTS